MTSGLHFTANTLSFLRALKRNNDRDWFNARRDEYEQHVRTPMLAIVQQLAVDLPRLAPELVADPKVSMFRPWRDTRFSHDKSPLKTNIAAMLPHRKLGKARGAGFYFEVNPAETWMGGGIYAPDRLQLLAIREHLVANHLAFARLVTSAGLQNLGGLQGEKLSRVPRGFDAGHPAAPYLMHKQWLAAREEQAAFATRPGFYKELLATITAVLPLIRFLNEPLETARSFNQPPSHRGTETSKEPAQEHSFSVSRPLSGSKSRR